MIVIDADRSDVWFTFNSYSERDLCIHPGECEGDCRVVLEANRGELEQITRGHAIELLQPLGAWDKEKLEGESTDTLYIRLIWVAAGNALDEDSLTGVLSTY